MAGCEVDRELYKRIYEETEDEVHHRIEEEHLDLSPRATSLLIKELFRERYYVPDMESVVIENAGLPQYAGPDFTIENGEIVYTTSHRPMRELFERQLEDKPDDFSEQEYRIALLAEAAVVSSHATIDHPVSVTHISYFIDKQGSEQIRDTFTFNWDGEHGTTTITNIAQDGNFHTIEEAKHVLQVLMPEASIIQPEEGIYVIASQPVLSETVELFHEAIREEEARQISRYASDTPYQQEQEVSSSETVEPVERSVVQADLEFQHPDKSVKHVELEQEATINRIKPQQLHDDTDAVRTIRRSNAGWTIGENVTRDIVTSSLVIIRKTNDAVLKRSSDLRRKIVPRPLQFLYQTVFSKQEPLQKRPLTPHSSGRVYTFFSHLDMLDIPFRSLRVEKDGEPRRLFRKKESKKQQTVRERQPVTVFTHMIQPEGKKREQTIAKNTAEHSHIPVKIEQKSERQRTHSLKKTKLLSVPLSEYHRTGRIETKRPGKKERRVWRKRQEKSLWAVRKNKEKKTYGLQNKEKLHQQLLTERNHQRQIIEELWIVLQKTAKRLRSRGKLQHHQEKRARSIGKREQHHIPVTPDTERYVLGLVLWFLLRMIYLQEHPQSQANLQQAMQLANKPSTTDKETIVMHGKETPWILFSIIWYLAMIREQGIYVATNHYVKRKKKKKRVVRKKYVSKQHVSGSRTIQQQGVIFVQ